MGQQGSNTTFRVGGTARQAGGNWTGRFENPEGLNAWHSMYGNRVEPGDTVTVGNAILKWTGSAYKVIDGDFVDGPAANAWAAKFSPELASSSTATIAGAPNVYRGVGVGWVSRRGVNAPVVGILGDSLSAAYSAPIRTALNNFGCTVINQAVSGSLISAQAARIPNLAACDWIYVQVGTNDILTSVDIPGLYGRYFSLYKTIKDTGKGLIIGLLPYASTNYTNTALANKAAYSAAIAAGADRIIDAYGSFMQAGGGSTYATTSSDGVHPANSAKVAIADKFLEALSGNKNAQVVTRMNTESLLLNGCFVSDTNADGVADSWTYSQSSATGSASLGSADTLGSREQQLTLSAASAGQSAMVRVYQEITTGFSAGDLVMSQCVIESTIPDAYAEGVWSMLTISAIDGGGSTIASSNPSETMNSRGIVAGKARQEWALALPVGTVKLRVSLAIKTLGAVTVSGAPCTAKFSRVGLYNLSAAGIPSAPAVNM